MSPRVEAAGWALAATVAVLPVLAPGAAFPQRDAGFSAVVVQHLGDAALGRAAWSEAPLGFPVPHGTARADWMLGAAMVALPLRVFDPSRAYALVAALGVLSTALACGWVARRLVGPGPHTWVAALVGGAGPVQLAHLPHANLVFHAPAALGFGLALAGSPVAAGLLAGLGVHFGLYAGLHALVALGVGLLAAGDARGALRGLAAAGVVVLTALPVAALYRDAEARWGAHLDPTEVREGSVAPLELLDPTPTAPIHEALGLVDAPPVVRGRADAPPLEPPNAGYAVTALAMLGAWRGRRERATRGVLGLWAAATALAFGPWIDLGMGGIYGPHALFGDGLRGPARWMAVSHVAVGLLAARALLPWTGGARGGVLGLGAVGLALAELPRPDVGRIDALAPPAEVERLLAGAADVPGPLLERFATGCECAGSVRLRAALFHRRPLVGGEYARAFDALGRVNRLAAGWPRPETVALARGAGVRVVLEHPPVRGPAPEGWRCAVDGLHRLCVDEAPLDLGPLVPWTGGPVAAVRLPYPGPDQLELRCGDAPRAVDVRPWRVLAEALEGRPTAVVVRLDPPCAAGFGLSTGEALSAGR